MGESLRLLSHVDDLRRCEEVEREVWGLEDREVLSGTHMRALVHAGGMAAGAFVDDELAGFVFGFPALHEGPEGGAALHSHLLAVLPRWRGRRFGVRLKWFQRGWCLSRGLQRITWTFDPLQLGNARLNLEHLGASSGRYLVDFYGRFGGTLSGSVSTDRLLVEWDLDDSEVTTLAAGRGRPPASSEVPSVLAWLEGNEPGTPGLDAAAPSLHLSLPRDFTAMITAAPALAERWRERVRIVLMHYFAKGYRVKRVVSGGFLLQRPDTASEEENHIIETKHD